MSRKARNLTPQMQAVAYVRVSTQSQVDDGVSLEAQQARIAAWCAATGYTLVQTFIDEGLSGASMEKRPELHTAIKAVCACRGALVVYSLSRLARNTKETLELGEQLDRAGADLVSLSEKIDTTSAAGKMMFRFMAVLAEFERDQISERTSMALQYKKTKQERVSGRIPYGKQLASDGVHLDNNPAEQAVIAIARELHRESLSSRQIAVCLAQRGLYSRVGTVFTPSAILAMVA